MKSIYLFIKLKNVGGFSGKYKMEDYWRPVPIAEYADRYLISRNGEVWSIVRKIMMKTCTRSGYPAISLYNGTKQTFSIHTLIAGAFLDRDNSNLVVNHKDGVKTESVIDNLEWVTRQRNAQHALETGLKVPHTKKVSQYTMQGLFVCTFDSIKEASEKTGCSAKHIPSVCRGKRGSTGNFIWRYVDEDDMPVAFSGFGLRHPKFPNYLVKSDGQVYSEKTNRYLKPKLTEGGYHSIGLCNNGIKEDFLVHILVAELYLTPDPTRPVVNHKDTNKLNNNVENLEWNTDSENITHAIANLGFNYKKSVSQYSLDGMLIETFASIRLANAATKVDNSSIVRCCKGKAHHAGNFLWKYTD